MRIISNLLCALMLAASLTAQGVGAASNKNVDSIASEGNILALQLFGLLKEGRENTVFSPYAISESMALPFMGSEGSTQSQMARLLRYRVGQHQVREAFSKINEQLVDTPYFLSSSLWIQKGSVKPEFKAAVEKIYGASLRMVDFITRSDGVRVEMNGWIKERTQGKIIDIVPGRELSTETRMVVLSGAFVKGRWQQVLDARSTQQAPFFSDRYSTYTVPTMFSVGEFNYLVEKEFSMLEIPYETKKPTSTKVSLLILLPSETHGLKSLESKLTASNLQAWLKGMQKKVVALSLPRFRVVDAFSLVDIFKKIALTEPFNNGANFSDIREVGDLKISRILHKTSYSVDEWGSEGGLASSSGNDFKGLSQQVEAFTVNHPFLFMVIDRSTDSILLIGRILRANTAL